MKKTVQKTKAMIKFVVATVVVLLVLALMLIIYQVKHHQTSKTEVITASTLEKIINVEEFSTFSAVYNGVAAVNNENKTDKIDYYVSYEATIKAGIDIDKIVVEVDHTEKIIHISIPEVYITKISVEYESLDFMFLNDKANTSSVSQEAYKICEEDVKRESEQREAIFDLAKQNAVNILTALINPIVDQLDGDYVLIVE